MTTTPTSTDPRTQAFREWIAAILERKGITRTELARMAGLSHSTLTRATTDANYRINFRADTMAKLAQVGGLAPPPMLTGQPESPPPQGFAEPQATLDMSGIEPGLPPGQSQWTARSPVLAAMGLMPGDHFILDQNATPRMRDMIVVQSYDHQTASADTLLRLYADGFAVTPLYLVDNTPRLWLDGGSAACMGVIIKSWRSRSAA